LLVVLGGDIVPGDPAEAEAPHLQAQQATTLPRDLILRVNSIQRRSHLYDYEMALSLKPVVDEAEGSNWYSSGYVNGNGYQGGGRKLGRWDVIAVPFFVEGIRLGC
jgi:hypothetical protein